MMSQLARSTFMSKSISVPTNWQDPSGDTPSKQYSDAFKPSERNQPTAPGLFTSASPNKYHGDTQKHLNDKFGDFIDGTCSAICSAWSTWQSSAVLTGVMVNAVTASGGSVVGPPWTPLILAQAPMTTPMLAKYSQVIASVIGQGWLSFASTILVPGLPWYPVFATVPAPIAPPMPNTPVPVAMLTMVDASIQASTLSNQMYGQLGDTKAPFAQALFDSISQAFYQMYTQWKMTTMVTNVLGTGPVPTFAPPFVPVGPVVGGVANMTPGGFV
jgi:hypothetical protein